MAVGRGLRQYPVPPPSGTRVDFYPELFEDAIRTHGHRLLWEKAAACPCRNSNEGDQPKITCPACFGEGWEYWGGQVIPGVLIALDLDQNTQLAYGIGSTGTVMITVSADHMPGFRDRYTNVDSLLRYEQWSIRRAAAGGLERLRYHIGRREDLVVFPDSEPFPPIAATEAAAVAVALEASEARDRERQAEPIVQDVLRLRLMDPATREPAAILARGVDFDVQDGRILWAPGESRGTAPAVGQLFTTSYLCHPRYVVTKFNHVQRDQYVAVNRPAPALVRLPIEVNAQLDFIRSDERGH